MGALLYALKALEASGAPSDRELKLRLAKLPARLRSQVLSGVKARVKRLGVGRGSDRLPYHRPCPAWTARLESDIGLVRGKGTGRALVWKLRRTGRGKT
jgi:hypothetical protein